MRESFIKVNDDSLVHKLVTLYIDPLLTKLSFAIKYGVAVERGQVIPEQEAKSESRWI